MQRTTLFQMNSAGGVKVWTIEVIDNGVSSTVFSTAGQQGGKMREDKVEVTIGKGKETPYSQACKDAQSKINSKIRKGYVTDILKIQSSSVLGTAQKPAPMLAHKYDPKKKQSGSKDLKGWGIEGYDIAVQRKKDGCRDNIKVTATTVEMNFRSGDPIPTNGLEHITESVLKTFQKIYKYVNEKYGVTEYTLDGELFIPPSIYPFNKANGLFRKEDKTQEELDVCKHAKFHLYDVMLPVGYETRYKVIQNWKSSPSVHVEEAIFIKADAAEIEKYLQQFLTEGEEGLMIRVLGVPYEYKRSTSLLKCKIFEDKEFVCVGFEEDVRGGMAGKVIVKMDCVAYKDGKLIETFKPGLKFSHAECKEMWENQSKYIGKKVTVEFFGRSEYSVPRFPKAKAFRIKND